MFASNTSQVSSDAVYIEDVFSTYLYTGNGSTQTITNGIDLAGKGGMVWHKARNDGSYSHAVADTARGTNKLIYPNETSTQNSPTSLTSFNSNGFSVDGSGGYIGVSGKNEVTWTFRKQKKFFDVVTWVGNGTDPRTISHNLGSTPGFIVVKILDTSSHWYCYHRSLGASQAVLLNMNNAAGSNTYWNSTEPTSTQFTVNGTTNLNGYTYVAYLFAHNAGGFGESGNDNVISCGSFTTDGSGNATVSLGYEPQLVMWKAVSGSYPTGNWWVSDNMRGFSQTGMRTLYVNTPALENTFTTKYVCPTATGFEIVNSFENPTTTYIYIAIRRGPMKTPTSGTSVFAPVTRTAPSTTVTSNTNPDLLVALNRNTAGYEKAWLDKLRGRIGYIASSSTGAEYTGATATLTDWGNTGVVYNASAGGPANDNGVTYVDYYFTRAPGFMDEVCYTGTGATLSVSHNLGVVPELIIFKRRDALASWPVWRTATGTGTSFGYLNDASGDADQGVSILTATPTSTSMSVGAWGAVNGSGGTYVAYLFASCPGVSKVGTYTGTGVAQTIDCGFTSGARFVMIKRTNGNGDWLVFDTARGIVVGNDKYSRLNTTAAEVGTGDFLTPQASGFGLTTITTVNASGGTYLYLAIA